jgi:hypothetical protein
VDGLAERGVGRVAAALQGVEKCEVVAIYAQGTHHLA